MGNGLGAKLAPTHMRSPDSSTPNAAAADTRRAMPRPLHALLIDVEPATTELISLWLAIEGWQLHTEAKPDIPVALIVIELAFPRHGDAQRPRALSEVWPGVPIVALSPTFFADVPAQGDVARQLGASAVLATPIVRERLIATVRRLVPAGP
jgi:hypothetical protein